jgi:hypothetical protein
MEFLMELAFAKSANDFSIGDHSNVELRTPPTTYDNPDINRKVYHY